MTRLAAAVRMAGIFALMTFAQKNRPSFDVASIRIDPPDGGAAGTGLNISQDGITWRNTRLLFCLAWAYDIPGRILGPEWIKDRYDIVAKAAEPTGEADLKLMAQTLLES